MHRIIWYLNIYAIWIYTRIFWYFPNIVLSVCIFKYIAPVYIQISYHLKVCQIIIWHILYVKLAYSPYYDIWIYIRIIRYLNIHMENMLIWHLYNICQIIIWHTFGWCDIWIYTGAMRLSTMNINAYRKSYFLMYYVYTYILQVQTGGWINECQQHTTTMGWLRLVGSLKL